MLPNTDHSPTSRAQPAEVSLVTRSVYGDLHLPKSGQAMLPLWKLVAMPKIAINEYRQPLAAKNKVG